MKKKKNKSIYRLSIIFVVIFLFSFVTNIISADVTLWGYNETPIPTNTHMGFPDQASCQADYNLFIKNNIGLQATPCQSYVSAGLPTPAPVTQPPVLVTPQKTTTPSSVYNLLAPIGTFKVAPDNIGDYFNTIFLIAIGLCGALAVIMIVIGGIQYMGDESIFGKTEAKSKITSAILGLLIALGAYALLNTINPALLGGNINIKQVSAAIDDTPLLVESPTPTTGVAVGTKGLCPGGLGNVVVGGATLMHTCASISAQVTNMITLALSQGIKLSGSSYRSNADQMALRVKNCANALTTPSNQCNPPTAIAGNSKHESGLAIDFKCNGTIIQTTDNACFLWLQTNAKNYGLKNFQPEPWHWST